MTDFTTRKSILGAIRRMPVGTELTYHIGHLARDRMSDRELDRVAKAAWDAMEEGQCTLVQRRGLKDFYESEYLVVKLPKPHVPVRWVNSYSPDNPRLLPNPRHFP